MTARLGVGLGLGFMGALTALVTAGSAAAQDAAATAPAAPPPVLAAHQAALDLNGADTGWLLVSAALVLFMTLPGLALFYGGMVRRKNVIATVTQSVAISAVVTVLWFAVGYSLTFSNGGDLQSYIGGLGSAFLGDVRPDTANALLPGIPEYLFIAYQMTFAIITPALIAGAFAERMKFSALLLFSALWSIVVYAPIAHWVWGGGFLGSMGVLDFAGGAVVHVNAGVAGLVCALFMGPRHGFRRDNMAPHNLVLTMIGASMLLVGWIGFNAGSAGAANALAAVALLNTVLAAMAAALSWMLIEWITHKKPTLLGLLSGIVGGLVAITPAAGFVNPMGALIIGLVAGVVCFAGAIWLKNALKYDDSLDAFGVHGIGGIAGALLTGLLADPVINSLGEGADVGKQALGLVATVVWCAVATFAILWICKLTTGLRPTKDEEIEGLDTVLHGEALHD